MHTVKGSRCLGHVSPIEWPVRLAWSPAKHASQLAKRREEATQPTVLHRVCMQAAGLKA